MRLAKPEGVQPPTGQERDGLTDNLKMILGVLRDLVERH
jgi:hypothetical protein